jgi:hypothetical protein
LAESGTSYKTLAFNPVRCGDSYACACLASQSRHLPEAVDYEIPKPNASAFIRGNRWR